MADGGLISTGELARRVGRSQSGIRKLATAGVIPPGTTIVGSGRFVWQEKDFPAIAAAIEASLAERAKRGQRPAERVAG